MHNQLLAMMRVGHGTSIIIMGMVTRFNSLCMDSSLCNVQYVYRLNKRHPLLRELHCTLPFFSNNGYLAQEIYKVSPYDRGCHALLLLERK